MGDGHADKKTDDLDAAFLEHGQEMPKFGPEQQPAPLPALPSEKVIGHSHASYGQSSIQIDEQPVDWRRYVEPVDPGSTFKLIDLEPGAEPSAPNTHQDRLDAGMRGQYWRAYSAASRDVEEQQTSIASDYHSFMVAQKNPDLRALGFLMPTADWAGDAATLADQQVVGPNLTTKELFRSNGTLNMSPADSQAIGTAGHRLTQRGDGKQNHDALDAADHDLLSKVEGLESAANHLDAGYADLDAAAKHIEEVKLRHEVAEDREALEEAARHAEMMKAGIEFFAGGIVKYAVLEAKEFGDLVESVGAMATYAVGRVDEHSIDSLESKLKADTKKLQTVEGEAAHLKFESAKLRSLGLLHQFRAARHEVLASIQKRQQAYSKAGVASAANSGGSASSRSKIVGVMTAIPAVEVVLGLAKNVAQRAAEGANYSLDAGFGFNMAVQGQRVQATHLIASLDQIEYVRIHFNDIVSRWSQRLQSLHNAQTLLGGYRPTADIGRDLGSRSESAESSEP
jgi:hypothetical protein